MRTGMNTLAMDDRGVIKPCAQCGEKNRIPFERLGQKGRCGECHAELSAPDVPVQVTQVEHFDRLIEKAPIPVVVDFWAPWCGPCKMMEPELEKAAAAGAGAYLVAKVNVDELPQLAQRFNVRSIPTTVKFSGGREVGRRVGALHGKALDSFVREPVA